MNNANAPKVDFDELLAEQEEWARRATEVQAQAALAYARLLALAESSDTGQASRVARFVAGTFNGKAHPFDLFDLRGLDVSISDDMLICLDALRWAKADLFKLVPNGEARVRAIIKAWNL